jgi:AcrR family transcriptional regulator
MNNPSVQPSALRRQREREERREAILAAAERVIIARGFAEASMDGVAGEAGLAAGTVYLYFPNKEALFDHLLCSKVRLLNEAVAAEIQTGRVFAETARAVVRAMFLHFEQHRGFFEIFVRERIQLSRGDSRCRGVFAEIDAGVSRMAAWIRTAQKNKALARAAPRLLATALRGLVFQFTRDWLRGGCRGRLTKHAAFVADFFLKGAAA